MNQCRVAIVHEWLTSYVGSEKVLEQLLLLFREADLFVVADFLPSDQRGFLGLREPRTTFIQKLPFARKLFRKYLPLMPLAIEGLDVSKYDLVISSSHAVAKGVLTGPDQLHICYCHSPIRYAWDLQHRYLQDAGLHRGFKRAFSRLILHYMRIWDQRTANGVDAFVANSAFIGRRIRKVYGRSSDVIYPPVDVRLFQPSTLPKQDYYLTVSRLVPYKQIETIVEAFTRMGNRRLIVVGDGPLMKKCQAIAGPNVELLGYQPAARLLDLIQHSRAFVFAAEEDFGISVVEAQACGIPVICYGKGGATETVIPEETGIFFSEQTPESIISAVRRFESREKRFCSARIRHNAERFSNGEFRRQFLELVQIEQRKRSGAVTADVYASQFGTAEELAPNGISMLTTWLSR